MNVFVTGGTGYIGRALITALVARGRAVTGPGHRWPILLKPLYWIWELLPPTRGTARRLGLLTLEQMVAALVRAIEEPPPIGTIRIVDVPAIRETTLD